MLLKKFEERLQKCIYLEFHGTELVQYVTHTVSDDVPCDFVVGLCCRLNGVPSHVVKCNHVLQHTDCFVEWAETIVR